MEHICVSSHGTLAGDHSGEGDEEEMLRAASVLTAIADGHWTGKLALTKLTVCYSLL